MHRPLGKMVFWVFLFGTLYCAIAAASNQITSNRAYLKVMQRVINEIRPNDDAMKILELVAKLSPTFKHGQFPKNDDLYAALRGYTYEAPYNVHFDKAYTNLIKSLPANVYQKNLWLANLANLTTYPTQYYPTPIGNFVGLAACKPHSCPTSVRMLFDPKTKKLWGIVHTENDENYLLGNPTDEQLVYLILSIGNELILY